MTTEMLPPMMYACPMVSALQYQLSFAFAPLLTLLTKNCCGPRARLEMGWNCSKLVSFVVR